MDIRKELRGKWVEISEDLYENPGYIIFGERVVKARKFMGENKITGFYRRERELIFIGEYIVCFTVSVSESGDVLTLTSSDGIVIEYIKCPGYILINEGLCSIIAHSVCALIFLGLIASIAVLFFM